MRLPERREMPTVYEPAEDSRLLAETAAEAVAADERVLEVGVGSGYVAATVREATGAVVVGCDISPDACAAARESGVGVVRADLTAPFAAGSADVVLCNPPYLPTPPEREWDDPMERALSGGPDGRAVVDPFLAGVGRVLKPDGEGFLLISTLTGPDEVRETATAHGLETSVVAEESHPFERLLVLRLQQRG